MLHVGIQFGVVSISYLIPSVTTTLFAASSWHVMTVLLTGVAGLLQALTRVWVLAGAFAAQFAALQALGADHSVHAASKRRLGMYGTRCGRVIRFG